MLAADLTLRDLMSLLPNPEAYARGVVGAMHPVAREHGAIVVRLGITGSGHAPNYRIESAATGLALVAIDGANHKPWPSGVAFDAPVNWSTATASFDEVKALLGELRGWQGVRPPPRP